MIMVEEPNGILNALDWAHKGFINEDVKISLFVPPVDFKEGGESGKEESHLLEGAT